MTIQLEPVGHVQGGRTENIDDDWGAVESVIALDPARYGPEALKGLDAFSHVLVVFVFDRIEHAAIATAARRPRGNPTGPRSVSLPSAAVRGPTAWASPRLRLSASMG